MSFGGVGGIAISLGGGRGGSRTECHPTLCVTEPASLEIYCDPGRGGSPCGGTLLSLSRAAHTTRHPALPSAHAIGGGRVGDEKTNTPGRMKKGRGAGTFLPSSQPGLAAVLSRGTTALSP